MSRDTFADFAERIIETIADSFWSGIERRLTDRLGDLEYHVMERLDEMTTAENAAWNTHNHNVAVLADGYKSAVALLAVYREQIEQTDEETKRLIDAAVQDALDSDSAADTAKLEAADAVIASSGALDTPPPLSTDQPTPGGVLPTDTVTDTPSIHDLPEEEGGTGLNPAPATDGSDSTPVTESDAGPEPASTESDGPGAAPATDGSDSAR